MAARGRRVRFPRIAWWSRHWRSVKRNLNFFRVHVLFFTFTPLIFSGILFAANSPTPTADAIPYIDCLFNCVSAMTVCGLATVDLSRMTGLQQALLFIQCCLGSPVAVAWVMVFIRRNAFARRFAHVRVKTDVLRSRPRSKINFQDPSECADVLEIDPSNPDPETGSSNTAARISRSSTMATARSEKSNRSGGWVAKVFSRRSTRSRSGSTTMVGGDDTVESEGAISRRGARTTQGELSTVEESEGDTDRPSRSTSRSRSRDGRRRRMRFGARLMGLGGGGGGGGGETSSEDEDEGGRGGSGGGSGGGKRLTTTMIRRINDKLRAVDPSGVPTEEEVEYDAEGNPLTRTTSPEDIQIFPSRPTPDTVQPLTEEEARDAELLDDSEHVAPSPSNAEPEGGILRSESSTATPRGATNSSFPRTVTLQTQPTYIGQSHSQSQSVGAPRMSNANTRQSGHPLGHTMTVEFIEPDRGRGELQTNGADIGRGRSITMNRRRGRSMSEARSVARAPSSSVGHGGGEGAEVVWDDPTSTLSVPTYAPHLRPRRTPTVQSTSARSHHTTRLTPPTRTSNLPRTPSMMRDRAFSVQRHPTLTSLRPDAPNAMHTGYGGFPGPHVLLGRLMKKFAPRLRQQLDRTLTIPRTTTMQSQVHGVANAVEHPAGVPLTRSKSAPYLTFPATIGRNSNFRYLTEDELEELGGVEYRALNALLWIVGAYHILVQVIAFIVIWPYISHARWRSNFQVPQLHRYVAPGWFSAFQVVSSYTNTGMSLVDQSMVPFQRAYPMIFFMAFLILAGNTAFPIFLRLTIWTITKCVSEKSRTNETLHFLLDHPRRCFIYLFPSHQTWFLLTVLVTLNFTDWFFFLVLDIDSPTFDAIPLGVRFAIGLLQANAVRAAGFATISISSLAPAVQVLYVMMMYISVYPIAMSVRSTNVYEERSLGIFDEEYQEQEPDAENGSRVVIWGRYLAWHARKQLAFDMWWLGLALFLVCAIERSKIQDQQNAQYFTIFNIIFELISAYGTVGLSLGVPFGNFSFSGAFTSVSKLIVCAVMIRGRHRGLPVAIDRAVMLPFEFKLKKGKGGHPADVTGASHHETKDYEHGDTTGFSNKEPSGLLDVVHGTTDQYDALSESGSSRTTDVEIRGEDENTKGGHEKDMVSHIKDENESLKEKERTDYH